MSKNHSRRAVLAGIAAAPAFAAPALALSEPDPIFDLIERHRVAYAAVDAALKEIATANERPEFDSSAVEALEKAEHALFDERYEIDLQLAQTRPATLVGIVAIMRYRRELKTCDGYDLFPMKDEAADPRWEITSWLVAIERSIAGIAGVDVPVFLAGGVS